MSDALHDTTVRFTSAAPRTDWTARVLVLVLALGCPALVAGALFSDFLRYDDLKIVAENPLSRDGLTRNALREVASIPAEGQKGYYGQFIPLTYLTLGLQYRLHGPHAWLFRLVNILFHLGTALLLFRVILALVPRGPPTCLAHDSVNSDSSFQTDGKAAAALGAAFFYFHPTNVESVAWAAERNNVQGLFFAVLAWWLLVSKGADSPHWRRLQPPTWGYWGLALLAFAAALLSKPAAIGLAPLLVLTELLWMRDAWLNRLARAAGFAILAVLAALAALRAGAQEVLPVTGGSFAAWALTSFSLIGRYLWHALAPFNLSFFYGIAPASDAGEPWVWLTVVLLAAVIFLFTWLPAGWQALTVLLGGAVLALGPTMAPQTIPYLFQDRYLYFALAPAAALVGLGIEGLHYRFRFLGAEQGRRLETIGLGVATLVCFVLALFALRRSFDFHDDETLYRDAVAKQPRSFFACFRLADELCRKGNRDKVPELARKSWEEADQLVRLMKEAVDADRHPSPAVQRLLEGELAWRLGRPESRELLRQVMEEARPEQVLVRAKANWILAEMAQAEYERTKDEGFLREREGRLRQVLDIVPENWPEAPHVILALADALRALGRYEDARMEYEKLRDHEELWPQAQLGLMRMGGTAPAPSFQGNP
jgi:tetratricopeptide (TPR) repeat protein